MAASVRASRRQRAMLRPLVCVWAGIIASGDVPAVQNRQDPWTLLRFEARKYLVGSSELELVRVPSHDSTLSFDANATLFVSTRSSVLGRTRHRWTRIEASSAIGWSSLSYAERDKARRLDYRPGTCLQAVRFDPASTKGKSAAGWSARAPVRLKLPPPELELVESQAIWSRLASWRERAPMRVAVAAKERWFELQVRLGPMRRQTVAIRSEAGDLAFSSTQQVELRLEPVLETEDAHLNSFVGPLTIWLDQATGIPVEIDGKHEDAGEIRFALRAVSFEPQPPPVVAWPELPPIAGDCALASPVDDQRPGS